MTYDEINQLDDPQEKQDKLKDFYINEIGVNDWLIEKSKTQKIRFKDRWEYKLNGQYHRLTGPAVEFHNESRGFYYIYGEAMNETDWKPKAQKLLRDKKLQRVLNDDNI